MMESSRSSQSPRGSVTGSQPLKQGMLKKQSKTLKQWAKNNCILKINGVRARFEYTKANSAPSKSGRVAWKGFELEQVESVNRPRGLTDAQFNVVLMPASDPAAMLVRKKGAKMKGETMMFRAANALDATEWIAAIESCVNMDHVVMYMKAKMEVSHRKMIMRMFFNELHAEWEIATGAARWGKRYQERQMHATVVRCFDAWQQMLDDKEQEEGDNRFAARLVRRAMNRRKQKQADSVRRAFDRWATAYSPGGAAETAARTKLETRLATMLAASARRVKELEASQAQLQEQLAQEHGDAAAVAEAEAAAAAAGRAAAGVQTQVGSSWSPSRVPQAHLDVDGMAASMAAMMKQFDSMETANSTLQQWQSTLDKGHAMLAEAASVLSPGADHARGSSPLASPPTEPSPPPSTRIPSPPAALPIVDYVLPPSPPTPRGFVPSPAPNPASPPATGASFFLYAEHWVADGPRRLRAVATTWLKRRPEMSALLSAEERLPVLKGQTITFKGEPLSANDFSHWRVDLDFARCEPPFFDYHFSASPQKSPTVRQPSPPAGLGGGGGGGAKNEDSTKRALDFDPSDARNRWSESSPESSAERASVLAEMLDEARRVVKEGVAF